MKSDLLVQEWDSSGVKHAIISRVINTYRVATITVGQYAAPGTGYAGDLEVRYNRYRLHTVIDMIEAGAEWLRAYGVTGVIIHVSGKNINRVTYRRLGFVPVHGCFDDATGGLMSASIEDVLRETRRRMK